MKRILTAICLCLSLFVIGANGQRSATLVLAEDSRVDPPGRHASVLGSHLLSPRCPTTSATAKRLKSVYAAAC